MATRFSPSFWHELAVLLVCVVLSFIPTSNFLRHIAGAFTPVTEVPSFNASTFLNGSFESSLSPQNQAAQASYKALQPALEAAASAVQKLYSIEVPDAGWISGAFLFLDGHSLFNTLTGEGNVEVIPRVGVTHGRMNPDFKDWVDDSTTNNFGLYLNGGRPLPWLTGRNILFIAMMTPKEGLQGHNEKFALYVKAETTASKGKLSTLWHTAPAVKAYIKQAVGISRDDTVWSGYVTLQMTDKKWEVVDTTPRG